jgi:hypothetical protein
MTFARETGNEKCRSASYQHETLERWMIREFDAARRLPLPRFTLTKLEHDVLSRRASAQQRRGLAPQLMHRRPSLRKMTMKTTLVLTAVLLLAGCEKRDGAPASDTSAMSPATSDTGMTHTDTTMARDTARR